jgi:putative addiction module component (TIGR02574 family)
VAQAFGVFVFCCYNFAMSQPEVVQAALQLPVKDRAMLAQKLLESLEQPSEAELEELWLEEIGKRIERVKDGKSGLTSVREALKLARARIHARN